MVVTCCCEAGNAVFTIQLFSCESQNGLSVRPLVGPLVGWFFFLQWKTQVCLINVFQSLEKVNILILRPTHADTQTHLHADNTHTLDS